MLKYKVKPRYAQKGPQWRPDSTRYHGASKGCGRCGKPQTHSLNNCPARDAECRTCKKKGHFAAVCKTKKKIDEIYQGDEAESIGTVFLGVVKSENSTDVWQRPIIINGEQIIFKLDTGAAVTAIPERLYSNGAFPLHGTVRFGTARYGTVRLSSGRFAFPPQFSTAIEWAGLFTRRYNCAASTAVTSS